MPRVADVSGYHVVGSRERVTVELENRQKESLFAPSASLIGQVIVSMGNYFTPKVDLWFGQLLPEYDYRISLGYHRTKGFVKNSDRSGGHVGVSGGMVFGSGSGSMEGYRLGGDVSYGTETYRFYGSLAPETRRTLSNYHFGVSLAQPPSTGFSLTPTLEYDYHLIADSSADTKQNRADVGLKAELPMGGITLVGNLSYKNATLSGAHSGHLTMFGLRIGTSRVWWNNFFAQGAADFSSVKGMSGQKISALYPDVRIGYLFSGAHIVSLNYSSEIGFTDLATSIQTNPYLSAGSSLRHSDRVRQIKFAVESDWSNTLRTRFSVTNEQIENYAFPADPLGTGVWSFSYGLAKFWKYQAEGFAKLTPNDYVSGKLVLNSSKNTGPDLAVPYVPELEAAGSFTHWFPFGISVSPSVTYQGVRETNTGISQEVPGFLLVNFRSEYEPISMLKIFIDLHNVTNKKYELWKGYQAPPFMISGGLSFRW
jgi:hypothetical protein